jgi:hypothetical protein
MPTPDTSEQTTIASLRVKTREALSVPLLLLFLLPLTLLALIVPWYLVLVVLTHARSLLAAW